MAAIARGRTGKKRELLQLGRSGEQGRLHQIKYLFLYYVSSIGRQQICSAQSRFPFEKIWRTKSMHFEIQALLSMLHSMVGLTQLGTMTHPVRKSSLNCFSW